jgi:proteasome assembly chaperone (PAC2) family protein
MGRVLTHGFRVEANSRRQHKTSGEFSLVSAELKLQRDYATRSMATVGGFTIGDRMTSLILWGHHGHS